MEKFRLAATQVSPRCRDLDHNVEAHLQLIEEAAGAGCQLVVFPELSTTGHNGSPEIVQYAQEANGPIFQAIHQQAKACNVFAAYGFCELTREI